MVNQRRRYLILLLLAGLLACASADAQMRRALLVGIDSYQPAQTAQALTPPASPALQPEPTTAATPPVQRSVWIDLDGAGNDVDALRAVLIERYGFQAQDIRVLKNAEATRDAILVEIRRQLIEPAAPGAISVFYYAGHGSQVSNSQSSEPDKKDETLVPADANRGAWDIRDKELRRLFNDILDKGALLTVIFDSCHSGSIARGLAGAERARFLPADPRDIGPFTSAAPADPRPDPERRGALVLSAAQDFEDAKEDHDPETGQAHGAFSLALLKVLRSAAHREPAHRVFQRTRAVLKNRGKLQEPVLTGAADRPLFGTASDSPEPRTGVAVSKVTPDGAVELQGGYALGLRKHTELSRIAPGERAQVRLQVQEVHNWSTATARVSQGDSAAIQVGDLFAVDRWAAADAPDLRLWLPPATLSEADLERLAETLAGLQTAPTVQWITDPSEETPTHQLAWTGTAWTLTGPSQPQSELGSTPTAEQVLAQLNVAAGQKAKLFVYFPPSAVLAAKLDFGSTAGAIALAASPETGDYFLVGRRTPGDRALQYAWMLPNVTRREAEQKLPLPVRTDWVEQSALPAAASQLKSLAERLGRLRAWLHLLDNPPPDNGRFPYTLALQNARTDAWVTSGTVFQDDEFRLVLRAPENAPLREQRYIYIFTLDSFGNRQLLFPLKGQGNVENRIPYTLPAPAEIPLSTRFKIGAPFGIDTYILLSSREELPDPQVLEYQGVRTRGRAPDAPLGRLLYRLDGQGRGQQVLTPVDWSISALSLRSAPR